jgi:DNA-binding protein YbaB
MMKFLVNILELQKQPQEIKRELKNAREELVIAKAAEEQIEGDRFADSIEVNFSFKPSDDHFFIQDFITRADDDVARLEQLDEEMTNTYQDLCDFLAVDPKNYSLTEFFTDLKLFCNFFSVDIFSLSRLSSSPLFFSRLVFKRFEYGVNKPLVQLKQRKYYLLKNFEDRKLSRVRYQTTKDTHSL